MDNLLQPKARFRLTVASGKIWCKYVLLSIGHNTHGQGVIMINVANIQLMVI